MAPLHQTVYALSTPFGDGGVVQLGMADDADIRRENFKRLFPEWSPAEAVRKLWGSPSLWSDLYYGRKSFGEKIARRIEEKLQLQRMSLDDPDGPRVATFPQDIADALDKADDETRRKLNQIARTILGIPDPRELGGDSNEHGAASQKRRAKA